MSHRLTCLSCAAVNRVPKDKLRAGPKCGTCGAKLIEPRVRDIDTATLRKAERNDTLPLVVDFWAPWCGPCRAMAPQFEAAARELIGTARMAKINTQIHADATQRYGIRGIPALIRFQNGQERGRLAGARPAGDIAAFARDAATTRA